MFWCKSKTYFSALYNGHIIGTNKESLYNYKREKLKEEYELAKKQLNSMSNKLKLIESINHGTRRRR